MVAFALSRLNPRFFRRGAGCQTLPSQARPGPGRRPNL